MSLITVTELQTLYIDNEMSMADIGKQLKCSTSLISKLMHIWSISIRSNSHKTKKWKERNKEAWDARTPEQKAAQIARNRSTPFQTQQECIVSFKNVHGEMYNYSAVVYRGATTKVEIICNKHGSFMQIPAGHKSGAGCPVCGKEALLGGYDDRFFLTNPTHKTKDAAFYIIKLHNDYEVFYKCGITIQTMKQRFSTKLPYAYDVLIFNNMSLYDAYLLERKILYETINDRYLPLIKGYTECLTTCPIHLVS